MIEAVALLGWRLYPASHTSKHGCFKGATDAATYDLDTLARWSREFPRCNWRVVMEGSGIWALDVDAPGETHEANGIQAMKDLTAKHGPLPKGPRSRSGGGGYGVFFKHTHERITGRTGTPAPGIDPRRGRLSITIPPSVHVVTGKPYEWLVAPWDVSPPVAPAWLLKAVEPPPEPPVPVYAATGPTDAQITARMDRAVNRIAGALNGSRNQTLSYQAFNLGCMIRDGMISRAQGFDAAYHAAKQAGLPHQEIVSTINSAFRGALGRRS